MQLYKVGKSWEQLPKLEEAARKLQHAKNLRRKQRIKREADALRAAMQEAEKAALAAAAGGDEEQQQEAADVAAAAAAAAAVAEVEVNRIAEEGVAEQAADDGDDVMTITGEIDLDAALLLRRHAAERSGMMIDLTKDAADAEVEAALVELDKVRLTTRS